MGCVDCRRRYGRDAVDRCQLAEVVAVEEAAFPGARWRGHSVGHSARHHTAEHRRTEPHQTDDPPDLSRNDATTRDGVDDSGSTSNPKVAGSSPAGGAPTTSTLAASRPRRLRLLSTTCQRSRRGHSRGLIRQRGNAWQVIVHAGRDPLTGKRRNLTGTARTKRKAQALRARLLTQANEGKRPATDATVAQLLERWLGMADLARSTRVTYRLAGSPCTRTGDAPVLAAGQTARPPDTAARSPPRRGHPAHRRRGRPAYGVGSDSATPVGERPRSGSTPISWRRRTDRRLRFSRGRSDAPAAIALGAGYGVTASCRSLPCESSLQRFAAQVNHSERPLTSRFVIRCCPSGSAGLRPQPCPSRLWLPCPTTQRSRSTLELAFDTLVQWGPGTTRTWAGRSQHRWSSARSCSASTWPPSASWPPGSTRTSAPTAPGSGA
jgi:hypothetical protein